MSMSYSTHHKIFGLWVWIAVSLLTVALPGASGATDADGRRPLRANEAGLGISSGAVHAEDQRGLLPAAVASEAAPVYLPLVLYHYPPPPSIFGVQINRGMVSRVITQTVDLHPGWVRHPGISWALVESEPGRYDWSRVADVEEELRQLGARGLNVLVGIQDTPDWAQKVPGYRCGPIKDEALDDFAAFVAAAVRRYSVPPYNVRYWEIWNEPDVAWQISDPNSGFGCLGDLNDPYYGGGHYAAILKAVYPAVKAANPAAQVVFGGLLLDCDPDHPSGKDCPC